MWLNCDAWSLQLDAWPLVRGGLALEAFDH